MRHLLWFCFFAVIIQHLPAQTSFCTGSATLQVSIQAQPNPAFSWNANGLEVTFTNLSTGALGYSWDFGDGSPATSISSPTHLFDASGTYTVTLIASSGCGSVSFLQNISIQCPTIQVTIQPNGPTKICPGEAVELVATAGFTSYLWQQNGIPQSITGNIFIATDPGLVLVNAVDAQGCIGTASPILIDHIPLPMAIFTPIVNQQTAEFQNSSTNADTYFWNFGDGSTSTDSDPVHTYSMAGTFVVTLSASNNCGSIVATQTITIDCSNIQASILASGPTVFCTGESIALSAEPPGLNYQWFFNSDTLHGSNSSLLVTSIPGNYAVVVTDAAGCTDLSDPLPIAIIPEPLPGFYWTIDDYTVSFSDQSIGASAVTWDFGDGTPLSNEANPVHTYANQGIYSVIQTVLNACGTQVLTQVVNLDCPPFNVSVDSSGALSFCQGYNVSLSAPGGYAHYLWLLDGATFSNDLEINALVSGQYQVIVTNANGCTSASSPITVSVSPLPIAAFVANPITIDQFNFVNNTQYANSWIWDFGDGSPISTDQYPSHAFSPGIYTVTLTASNSCGTHSYSTQIVSCPTVSLVIAATGSASFCAGLSTELTATAGFDAYNWYLNNALLAPTGNPTLEATASGNYFVIGAYGNGCSAVSDTLTLETLPLPPANIVAFPGTYCLGLSLYIEGALTPEITQTHWSGPQGLSSDTFFFLKNEAEWTDSGTYTYTVTGVNGCTNQTSIAVNIIDNPAMTVLPSNFVETTYGTPVDMSVSPMLGDMVWSNGDTTYSTSYNGCSSNWVVQIYSNGCARTVLFDVVVNPVITALSNELTCTPAAAYQWYFNGEAIPGATDQTLIAQETGNYSVSTPCLPWAEGQSDPVFVEVIGVDALDPAQPFLKIYPNPARQSVHLSWNYPGNEWAVKVWNTLGQLVVNQQTTESQTILPVEGLPHGMYSAALCDKAGRVICVQKLEIGF